MTSHHKQIIEILTEAGLSHQEAAVYAELLKKPVAKGFDLIQKTGLSKSSVYRALEVLSAMKLIEKNEHGIRALSLSALGAELSTQERNIGKTLKKLRRIAPFLHSPQDALDSLELFYTPEQIKEAYVFMSEQDFSCNFDFGDFESLIPHIGGIDVGMKFRRTRAKHAKSHSICTTTGPYTNYFSADEGKKAFNCKVDFLQQLKFKNNFIIFSDCDDHVLYADASDPENLFAALVKSPVIAQAQRQQFQAFSQLIGNAA